MAKTPLHSEDGVQLPIENVMDQDVDTDEEDMEEGINILREELKMTINEY